MKNHSTFWLWLVLALTFFSLACSLSERVRVGYEAPSGIRPRRLTSRPTAALTLPTTTNVRLDLIQARNQRLIPALEKDGARPVKLRLIRPSRLIARSTPAGILDPLFKLVGRFGAATATPFRPVRLIILPSPTPTGTSTPTPTYTPLPTDTPSPTPTLVPTNTPLPPQPIVPPQPPTVTPVPTATPVPEYDFLLAEFFNSPTTNSFLLIYVAIVDPNEIPIGDLKVVGTRLDNNLTYVSPLSKWHYEGYSAPGEVIKSGNTKFEPPGGIETASWVLHLENDHGHRQSEDVPFDVDATNKQWYFIKFRRKF